MPWRSAGRVWIFPPAAARAMRAGLGRDLPPSPLPNVH